MKLLDFEEAPSNLGAQLRLGVSKNAIARITGVSGPTRYYFIHSRNLQPGHSRACARESGQYPQKE
ncbi:MAG: hypothetical protein OXP66_13265 [Candidatus Tectomicrobia bacterium]|nr:hypothetical protein [Candidatus Tectomicrobia bacterium]